MAKRQAEERARENGDAIAGDEKKEIDLGGVMDEELAAEAKRAAPAPPPTTAAPKQEQDSDTEDEEEVVMTAAAPRKAKETSTQKKEPASNTTTNPLLDDFEKKLADPSLQVEDVIDEMGASITTKVINSFGSNGYSEARKMIEAMRRGAIEYEEAERFNTFLRKFKALVLDESSPRPRSDFWDGYMRGRDALSLISDRESMGDALDITDKEATAFINL